MNRTEKTLLEHMKISDVEIARRMKLMNLDKGALETLASHSELIDQYVDDIVDEFYATQTQNEEISLLIGDVETLQRLRSAQRRYVIDLFAGHYDGEYVNARLRIGMVHKRIGVEPKLYLSAVLTLKEVIVKRLRKTLGTGAVLTNTLDALEKLFYFDISFVFDTYIDCLVGAIDAERHKTEIYAKGLEDKVAERTRQLEEQARLDPLTNLYNQRAMQELLRRELALAKRRQAIISIVYCDVDNFKSVNDSHGHARGNEVLKDVAASLLQSVRASDVTCRYGGDEFCVILPDCDPENARLICEKVVQEFSGRCPECSLSIGIASTGPEQFSEGDQLVHLADQKMYQAKKTHGFQIQA